MTNPNAAWYPDGWWGHRDPASHLEITSLAKWNMDASAWGPLHSEEWQQPVRDAFAAWRPNVYFEESWFSPERRAAWEESVKRWKRDRRAGETYALKVDEGGDVYGGHPDGLYASFNAVYGDPVKYTVYKDNEVVYQGEDYLAAKNAGGWTAETPTREGFYYVYDARWSSLVSIKEYDNHGYIRLDRDWVYDASFYTHYMGPIPMLPAPERV